MARRKTHKIDIKGLARLTTVDLHRAVVIFDDAASLGILSGNKIKIDPLLLPADWEPGDYEIKGSYSLSLTLIKKK